MRRSLCFLRAVAIAFALGAFDSERLICSVYVNLTQRYLWCQDIYVKIFALLFLYKFCMGEIPVSKIAERRKAAGLTQRELAQMVGVTETTIRNWENNRAGVDWLVKADKMCRALDCDPGDLYAMQEIGGDND